MAHLVDLTLFYGGIASAPAAELPLAGSSFDVQAGTNRHAVFGVVDAVPATTIHFTGVVEPHHLGQPRVEVVVHVEGVASRYSMGKPWVALRVAPESVCGDVGIGTITIEPAHEVMPNGIASGLGIGLPFVGFGLVVAPIGLGARARGFGAAEFAWRKCPRFDRGAVLIQASEIDARIRPAPAMPQVWRGEAQVWRDCHMGAVLARVLERRTVARLKNEARAAVCRKEQI